MSLTRLLPLGSTTNWYGDNPYVNAVLLDTSVTNIPDTAAYYNDISAFEVTDPGYASYGIEMGRVYRTENGASSVVEWDTRTSTWSSTGTLTVAAFRWIVLIRQSGGAILAAHDLGVSKALTGEPLVLTITESPYSPGVYPIMRMKRALT